MKEELSEYSAGHSYSNLPEEVREKTRLAVLNVLAVSIGGNQHPQAPSLVGTCREIQDGSMPIYGTGRTAGKIGSAWANASLTHLLDFDDTHLETVVHPSAPVIPAAMAVGIDGHLEGRNLLYASTMGMEAAIRLGETVGMNELYSDWHNTSLYGTASSAVACSVMRGASASEVHASMFQGLSVATGFLSNRGTLSKSFQVGRSAAEGLISSMASSMGVTVSENILNTFAKSLNGDYRPEKLNDGIGNRWTVMKNYLKPYPCGVVLHPGIDAAVEARAKGLSMEDVESIDVYVNPIVLVLTAIMEPVSGLQSKFSVTHAIACALVKGPLFPEHFSDSAVSDPSVLSVRKKLRIHGSDEINRGQTRLEFTLKGGHRETVEINRGPETPSKHLEAEDVKKKFNHLVIPVVGEDRSRDVWDYFSSIDTREDLHEIVELFR